MKRRIPTRIVDKNGRHTTVYRTVPRPASRSALSSLVTGLTSRLTMSMQHAVGVAQESPYAKTILPLLHSMNAEYGDPLVGRTRAVFDRGDGYVIKLALNDEVYLSNSREVVTSEAMRAGIDVYTPVAHTEYWDVDERNSVIIMEKVTPVRGCPTRRCPIGS